jgi:sigma-54 specific flagellar transcriptional regulator A
VTFTEDFLEALKDYHWPGNVRELSNLVDRFSTLYEGQVLALRTVTPNLLPRGLAALQAERCPEEPPASAFQAAVAQAHHAMADACAKLSAETESEDEVEDIILLAQGGLPTLPPGGVSLKDRLAEIERDLISQALSRTDGNVSQTARLLSLQRTTLIEKIHKYALRPTAAGGEIIAS